MSSLASGLLFLITLLTADITLGQVGLPPIDPSGRSSLPPLVQQEQPLQPKESPAEILPPVEPTPEELNAKGFMLRAFVTKIQVVGSTVLSQEELQQLSGTVRESRDHDRRSRRHP